MIRVHRSTAIPAALLVLLLLGVPADLAAGTTVPPPFDFINGLISYIRSAAIPTIILSLMIGGIAWLFAKNGEGIVQWSSRAFVVLAIILGAGTLLTAIGFQGAVV